MTLQNRILNKFPFTNKEHIKEYEAIADEFAIGFAKWIYDFKGNINNVKELLEIYKKEKGL